MLERLQNDEDDVLRFMVNKAVPFTNNQGENDLRMAKVQQKISGCFRSEHGADMFFGLRSNVKVTVLYCFSYPEQRLLKKHYFKFICEGGGS